MSKVLVLYYPSCGHIEAMANGVAEGARQTGATRFPLIMTDRF
jgi:NAD(P)H dehydrogenase (quinone)